MKIGSYIRLLPNFQTSWIENINIPICIQCEPFGLIHILNFALQANNSSGLQAKPLKRPFGLAAQGAQVSMSWPLPKADRLDTTSWVSKGWAKRLLQFFLLSKKTYSFRRWFFFCEKKKLHMQAALSCKLLQRQRSKVFHLNSWENN